MATVACSCMTQRSVSNIWLMMSAQTGQVKRCFTRCRLLINERRKSKVCIPASLRFNHLFGNNQQMKTLWHNTDNYKAQNITTPPVKTIRHAKTLHRAGMVSYSTNEVLPVSSSFIFFFPFQELWGKKYKPNVATESTRQVTGRIQLLNNF